jgi:hypothetical protein
MTIDEPKRERVKKGEQNSRETLQKLGLGISVGILVLTSYRHG